MGEAVTVEIKQRSGIARHAPEIGVVVGICLFLIGAQLPYWDGCFGEHLPCHPRRWIDLTASRYTSNSVLVVVTSYGRLAPLLVATALIFWSRENRRFAAGFIAFLAGILVTRYFGTVVPQELVAGSWEPGAALWPLGAIVMLVSAISVTRSPHDPGRSAFTMGWRPALTATLGGIGLIVAGLTIHVEAAAYLYPLGATALVSAHLALRKQPEPSDAPSSSLRRSRWLIAPLLIGVACILASFVVPASRGEFTYTAVRLDFLLHPTTYDFWAALAALVIVAGAVMTAIRLLIRSEVSHFLLGGATAGAYWLFVSATISIAGAILDPDSLPGPAVYLVCAGVLILWVSALWATFPTGNRATPP